MGREMQSFTADIKPPHAGAEAADGSTSGVRHPGSQAGADATEGAVFDAQHPGSLAGSEAFRGSVFRLRHPESGLIPGRIPGGCTPLHASAASSCLIAPTVWGSPAVRALKNISTSANQSKEAKDLAMLVPCSVHKPAADVAEGVNNVPVEIFDDDEGQGGGEEEAVVVPIGPKRRKFISPVWMHFERLKIGEKWKARCVHCSRKLPADTKNGTSHLYNHLRNCVYAKIRGGHYD